MPKARLQKPCIAVNRGVTLRWKRVFSLQAKKPKINTLTQSLAKEINYD